MSEYHKIQTVWLRDPATNHKTLLEGAWAEPEFGYLAEAEWEFTEKVDGTNVRLIRDTGVAGLRGKPEVRGKTDEAQMHPGLLEECCSIMATAPFLELPPEMILYGEGYGEKIQKGGGNYRSGQGFVLFDAWCGMWLERSSVEDIAVKLDIRVVPVIGRGALAEMVDWCRAGFDSHWGPFPAEGIVARPRVELLNRSGERIITKLKTKDFRR